MWKVSTKPRFIESIGLTAPNLVVQTNQQCQSLSTSSQPFEPPWEVSKVRLSSVPAPQLGATAIKGALEAATGESRRHR